MRVLIAEDDKPVASFVQKGLEAEQYAVDIAQDGDEAQFMVSQFEYDVAVLDLTLPRVDGLEVLKHIRESKPAMPVLILTGRNRVEDRVKGLDLGADDYLTKPFSFTELSARVRALLRRSALPAEVVLRVGDLELNRVERTVKRSGNAIETYPQRILLARVPDAQCRPLCDPGHDYRTRLEPFLRHHDQRCGRLHQLRAEKGGSWLRAQTHSHDSRRRLSNRDEA